MSGTRHHVEIRANTILPARRRPVELRTADGLSLVGELALPPDRDPAAVLVTLHPLPTHGGSSDSHLLRKAAWRLPALADVAVLRFNTRGTAGSLGQSEGRFDGGRGECLDVAAAMAFTAAVGPRWLLGWSFGADLLLRYGPDPAISGAILLSPPLRTAGTEELQVWAEARTPLLALVPELDDYLRPDHARERFALVDRAEVIGVEGARHLWTGERAVRRVFDEVIARIRPDAVPLPTSWAGAVETAQIPGGGGPG